MRNYYTENLIKDMIKGLLYLKWMELKYENQDHYPPLNLNTKCKVDSF